MKSFFIALFSSFFLSSCAYYAGLKDPGTIPPPANKVGTTLSTPTPARTNPASTQQNNAATTAGKMLSPITHF